MSFSESAGADLRESPPRGLVLRELVDRGRRRLDRCTDASLMDLAEDALWRERQRLERARPLPGEILRLDALARAVVRGSRADRQTAALALVSAWADEVHGHFDKRAFSFVTRVAPRAIHSLLTAPGLATEHTVGGSHKRIVLQGDIQSLVALAQEATLVLVPTHVSNLDSPLVGLALHQAGLPPFLYGAGLNLFSNKWLGWWMRRLGAYTVDRTKKSRLYLDLLKDYSVRAVAQGQHSLFFPGGTRSRNGAIETVVKKGLLGTGVTGWQESISLGHKRDVYFVPLTLSYQLVLEAGTLMDDHLAEVGKQRYIITDDESAAPTTVLSFLRRIVDLDATAVLHFGQPMDIVGKPVPGTVADRRDASRDRLRLVTDRQGNVEVDPQRDAVYSGQLAARLAESWPKYAVWMATHAAAWAAWTALERAAGTTDPFRLARLPAERRELPRLVVLEGLARGLAAANRATARGDGTLSLPESPADVLDAAVNRFARWHTTPALSVRGDTVFVENPRLCLYYRNRSPWAEPS